MLAIAPLSITRAAGRVVAAATTTAVAAFTASVVATVTTTTAPSTTAIVTLVVVGRDIGSVAPVVLASTVVLTRYRC